jgi:hypothetical protein
MTIFTLVLFTLTGSLILMKVGLAVIAVALLARTLFNRKTALSVDVLEQRLPKMHVTPH